MHLISGTLHSTPLPWLPVLANIESHALRRKAATDKLMEKIRAHGNCPINSNITIAPHACLPSSKPLWQDLIYVDIRSQWKENWKSAQVDNFSLVDDPTIRQPVFYLPRQQWTLLNVSGLHRVTVARVGRNGTRQPLICPCGEIQMMSHIVDSCPLTKLNVGLSQLHSADDEAVAWLISCGY